MIDTKTLDITLQEVKSSRKNRKTKKNLLKKRKRQNRLQKMIRKLTQMNTWPNILRTMIVAPRLIKMHNNTLNKEKIVILTRKQSNSKTIQMSRKSTKNMRLSHQNVLRMKSAKQKVFHPSIWLNLCYLLSKRLSLRNNLRLYVRLREQSTSHKYYC